MIRFVDLTEAYWTDPQFGHSCCAFLNTVDDCFVECSDGGHVFDIANELDELPEELRERCKNLVPPGFWDKPIPRTTEWQCDECAHVNERRAIACDDCGTPRPRRIVSPP